MRLPQFIARAVAFFDSAEAKLAKLEQAKATDQPGEAHCDACEAGKCAACKGTGQFEGAACSECEGSGKCDQCDGSGKAANQISNLKATIANLQKLAATSAQQVGEKETLLASKAAEIDKLKADLAAEKKRANEVIASQGLPPNSVPAAEANNPAAGAGENAWNKYQRLLAADPRSAGEFWKNNADAILAARPQ